MRIRYKDGSSAWAWILTLAGGVMRVAVKDGSDALELRLAGGEWLAEDGRPVVFEFPFGPGGVAGFVTAMDRMAADPAIRQACDGGECIVRQLLQGARTPQA